MITDGELFKLATTLGLLSMGLIVIYSLLENDFKPAEN